MWRKEASLIAAAVVLAGLWLFSSHQFSGQTATALTGIVSSDAEGPMEGVLVSAKRLGGTIIVTVTSDKDGRYAFPADRLRPGKYTLSTRATGYDAPKHDMIVTVDRKSSEVDLKLVKTSDLPAQLSWAEWLASVPGSPAEKDSLYACVGCHSPLPIFKSTYDAAAWVPVIVQMRNYGPAATLHNPIRVPYHVGERPNDTDFARYLSSINLSGGRTTWNFKLKTLPRPKGRATRAIVTEYELTRPGAMPQDVVVDSKGMVWYEDFATGALGRVDPRTGESREWTLPETKPGFPRGALNLDLDHKGNLWIGRVFQASVTRFDPRSESAKSWKIPAEYDNNRARTAMLAIGPDDAVWFDDTHNRRMYILNPDTGKMISYPAFPDWKIPDWNVAVDPGLGGRGPGDHGHFMYGVAVSSKGLGYWADLSGGNIGEMDPKTGKVALYPTPTPNAGPRRIHMDSDDQLWFGENYAFKIGMFDTRTKHFKEWDIPTPWDAPYDAVHDKAGYVWAAGWTTQLVTRLDPRTGEIAQYLLPGLDAEIRRVSVDDSTTPSTFWAGENREQRVVKVEPLQ
jgi:streptogramin lyase